MGDGEALSGREVAVPGQEADKDFKALPADVGPEKREFTEALRAQFRVCGLSLRAFGARYHHDHTTVWRYLNALHIPDRDFVEDVLAAVDAQIGAPVTAEVQSHLYALHLAVLKATSRNRYDNRVLSDRLVAETLQVQAARRQEQALAEELAQSKAKDQQLRLRMRELEAARDEDQIRYGAELVGLEAENQRLRDELHRLRERITTLQLLLDQAHVRRVQAEARCEELEQSLAAIEQDAEQERREELRLAEERERRRQEEEGMLRAALADLQRQSAQRDEQLAAEQLRAETREAELAEVRRRFGVREGDSGGGEERRRVEPGQFRRWLLDIWAAAAAYTMRDGRWTWGDAAGSNSVSDAGQLLTFLLPATAESELVLEDVANIAPDAGYALAAFGGKERIPVVLIGALEEFIGRYTRADGTCDFSGGNALFSLDQAGSLPQELRELDIVPSFTASVGLCLAAIGFLDSYLRFQPEPDTLHSRILELRAALSLRLTCALAGLLRGFTFTMMSQESAEGRHLLGLLNQQGKPLQQVLAAFHDRMDPIRWWLAQSWRGGQEGFSLRDSGLLFDVGWTWGTADDAPSVELLSEEGMGAQAPGIAVSAPYLHFTMQVTDTIEHLFDERAQVLGLLTEEQERLATALGVRRDLTQMYWSQLARFSDSWPLEDLPWRTVDDEESDYFSLFVCAILIQELRQRNSAEEDLRRIESLMSDLARRARITRRPLRDDQAVAVHVPGLWILMETVDPVRTPFGWRVKGFAPVLLKCAAQLASLTGDPAVRDSLLNLAVKTWNHLQHRLITDDDGKGIWDDPRMAFPSLESTDSAPSWQLTSQIVDALVTAWPVLTREFRSAGT